MELYTTDEVAKQLRVSRGAVLQWVKEGRLNAHRLGARTLRFTAQDIENFLFGDNSTTDETPIAVFAGDVLDA